MADVVRLRWPRDESGYELKDVPARAGSDTSVSDIPMPAHQIVVPRGGTIVRDLVDGRRLLQDLMNMRCDAEGVLAFVGAWGLPSKATIVTHIIEQVKPLQRATELMRSENWGALERAIGRRISLRGTDRGVSVNLRYARVPGESKPRLFFEPDNLVSYGWLEFMQIAAGETHLRRCLNCGRIFVLDGARGTRRTRMYCSDRCRLAKHRSIHQSD